MLIRKPRKGDRVSWPEDDTVYVVCRCEGNLCWMEYPSGAVMPFIWRFKDGLNSLATILERDASFTA